MANKPFAPWSYSKLKSFETCPRQYYHMKVAKTYTEPDSEHLRYGNEFHKACEDYVNGTPLPEKFGFAKSMLDALAKKPGTHYAEQKLGLTENLEACGFFARNVWYRGIVDRLIVDGNKGWIVDYKTSKNARYADKGQLELMMLAILKHYPDIEIIDAGLVFVISHELVKERYTRDDEARLWAKWIKRVEAAEQATKNNVWNPKPSGLCNRHCAVLECIHNGQG